MSSSKSRWSVIAAVVLAALPARALTLYDAALGTPPSAQGWFALQQDGPPARSVAGGSYRLDTTGAGVSLAGDARFSPLPLDAATGFDVDFSLRLLGENHTSDNRAGYSLLVTSADARQSIGIGFWADRVWAYDIDPANADRIVHGAAAAFDTGAWNDWRLSVRAGAFTLSAGGAPLLAGPLRDYTSEGAPYTFANLLFLGDDTSRGSSVSELRSVAVGVVPEPAAALLAAAGLAVLALRRRRGR